MKELLKTYYELLTLYNYLLLNSNNARLIEETYLKYLKICVKLGTNSPRFETKDYCLDGNCYSYALGLKYPRIFKKVYEYKEMKSFAFNLGFTGICSYLIDTHSKMLDGFYFDCDALNIKVFDSTLTKSNIHGGYKIALYFTEKFYEGYYDFHFVRENCNGLWSEKGGIAGPIKLLDGFPEEEVDDYKLVRVFEIVKPVIKK